MMSNEVAKFVRREELVKIIDRDLRLLNGNSFVKVHLLGHFSYPSMVNSIMSRSPWVRDREFLARNLQRPILHGVKLKRG